MGEPNWSNETMWTGDNLPILRGMNSESIDLIYLDPPFNSKTNYAAPIGSKAAGAEFKDTWTLRDIDLAWLLDFEKNHPKITRFVHAVDSDSDKSYLIYMAPRLLEMLRLLKPTGSIYVHCDPTMSHYLKLLMDLIFGRKAFRNEVVWAYQRWTGATKAFQRMHDTLLFYGGGQEPTFNMLTENYSPKSKHKGRRVSRLTDTGTLNQQYTGDDTRQKAMRDVWEISYLNSQAKERTGYPTQKPLALLNRIIQASSNEGDTILDPFCGCATACVAAHNLNRKWVGIDISPKAYELVRDRIAEMGGLFYNITQRLDIPKRTDIGRLPKYNCRENKSALYGEQQGNCNGCREHFKINNLTVDHIIARKVGGTDHLSNLQLLCGHCNSVKGSFGMEYLLWKLGSNKSKPWYKPGFPHYPSDTVTVGNEQMAVNEAY
ncbi:hypothetical protein F4009_18300 [Candidatus Poribacteria bacterium]|nr:hypothetical protein [Candidatus Poribacteria bacterium]